MKRGRPSKRSIIQKQIIQTLLLSNTPMTVLSVTREVSKNLKKQVSWNTVWKYMQELVKLDKVQPIQLPHSKIEGKTGLTVYMLKK